MEILSFLSVRPTIHHSRFDRHLVNLPFHSCCHPSVTNPPLILVSTCLHFLLHVSCGLCTALDGWYSTMFIASAPCSFTATHLYSVLHSSTSISPGSLPPAPYSHYEEQCHLRTSQSAEMSAWPPLSVCRYHYKQKGGQNRSLIHPNLNSSVFIWFNSDGF